MYINGLPCNTQVSRGVCLFGVLGRYRWRFVHVTYLVFPLATFTMVPRHALFVQRHAIFLNLHSIGKKICQNRAKNKKVTFFIEDFRNRLRDVSRKNQFLPGRFAQNFFFERDVSSRDGSRIFQNLISRLYLSKFINKMQCVYKTNYGLIGNIFFIFDFSEQ